MEIIKITLAYIFGAFAFLVIMFLLWGIVEYLKELVLEIRERRFIRSMKKTFEEIRDKHPNDPDVVKPLTEMIELIEKSEKK